MPQSRNRIATSVLLRISRQALFESQKRWRKLLEGLHDIVVPFDGEGKITHWSSSASRAFGWNGFEARGQRVDELLLLPQERDAFDQGLHRFLETREVPIFGGRVKILARTKEDHQFSAELSVVALRVTKGFEFYAIFSEPSKMGNEAAVNPVSKAA